MTLKQLINELQAISDQNGVIEVVIRECSEYGPPHPEIIDAIRVSDSIYREIYSWSRLNEDEKAKFTKVVFLGGN